MDNKNRLKSVKFTAFTAVLLLSSPVKAGGPLEHKVVAKIAEHRLSSQALDAVHSILGPGVGLDQISNCPDAIIYTKEPLNCGGAFTLHPEAYKTTIIWHFVDIPLTAPLVDAGSIMNYCPNGSDCVVEQIRRRFMTLKDPTAPKEKRQLALMYLVHLVDDEHKPLHCAEGTDPDGKPDKGGNTKPVTFLGVQKNLHALWDDLIMPETWQVQATMDPTPLVSRLEADIKGKNVDTWARGDYIDQACLEGFDISKKIIYPQYAKDQGKNLGLDFQQKMQPIAFERMEMAAVRLAALLEQALGPQPPFSKKKASFKGRIERILNKINLFKAF